MERWQRAAIDYARDWIDFQVRVSMQPGCIIAIAHRDTIVADHAFGAANLDTGEPLTPRHRFRIASHSKSFTAAGVMKLREQRRLRLDDAVGLYVNGLHPRLAEATLGQILSHSAGIVRDGMAGGQYSDLRPFVTKSELIGDLRAPPAIEPNTRFKYSNHGFALIGQVIEAVTGETYRAWIDREVIAAAGLHDTQSDMPLRKGTPFARGHSPRILTGRRFVIPGDYSENAIAPAGGVISTAADTARYFAQLAPSAKRSILSVASRREMLRKQWRNPDSSIEGHYGLGIMSGQLAGWDWFGHSGGLQGYISRTAVIPACDMTITILTNATDGWAGFWLDGVLHILRGFRTRGAPARRVRDWSGRWWSAWGAVDLVAMGDLVLIGNPHAGNPFLDASEIEVTGRDDGRIAKAAGYGSHGEAVQRNRNAAGKITSVRLAATTMRTESAVTKDMLRLYAPTKRKFTRRTKSRP